MKTLWWLKHRAGVSVMTTLCTAIAWVFVPTASGAQLSRSIVDRVDEVSGYQVHLVYVQLKGTLDRNIDTSGEIDSFTKEANNWLQGKLGHKFIFDTYQGLTDVSFMQSSYTASELCFTCKALSKLQAEFELQANMNLSSKTLVFVLTENLDDKSCGWASIPGNLALLHTGNGNCNSSTRLAETGLSGRAKTLIHELTHSYGVNHQCFDNSDMMIGTPECVIDTKTYGHITTTLDTKRSHYVGSESADGIDLLKMPIWSDNTGDASYALIKQTTDNQFVPTLINQTVYAIVGQKSGKFDWSWDKKFYPQAKEISCQFKSGLTTVIGSVEASACVFNIPSTLRAGKNFTITQNWNRGPWHGTASVEGTLTRADYTSNICTENTCIPGGTTIAPYRCWTKNVTNVQLQQLVENKWITKVNVATLANSKCKDDLGYPMTRPDYNLDFNQTGTFIYRWFIPEDARTGGYSGAPFVVVTNDESSPEPTKAEVDSAQAQAVELGRLADQAQIAADKAAAALAASLKKTTITCIKGKLSKQVTAIKPSCPAGYKKK